MFAEHIVTKFSTDDKKFVELAKYGIRIELVSWNYLYYNLLMYIQFLKTCPEFTRVLAIQKVQTVLRALDGDTGKKEFNFS